MFGFNKRKDSRKVVVRTKQSVITPGDKVQALKDHGPIRKHDQLIVGHVDSANLYFKVYKTRNFPKYKFKKISRG